MYGDKLRIHVLWQDTTKRHSSMLEDRVQRSCGKTLLRNRKAAGQSTEGYVASHYQHQRQAIVHEDNVRVQVMWHNTTKAQLIHHTRRQCTHALCQDTINLLRQTPPRDNIDVGRQSAQCVIRFCGKPTTKTQSGEHVDGGQRVCGKTIPSDVHIIH